MNSRRCFRIRPHPAGFIPPISEKNFRPRMQPRLTWAKGARQKVFVSVYSHDAKHGLPLAELLKTTVVKNLFCS
jgi:hypothetical protein